MFKDMEGGREGGREKEGGRKGEKRRERERRRERKEIERGGRERELLLGLQRFDLTIFRLYDGKRQ